jgi:hypothetical protein
MSHFSQTTSKICLPSEQVERSDSPQLTVSNYAISDLRNISKVQTLKQRLKKKAQFFLAGMKAD